MLVLTAPTAVEMTVKKSRFLAEAIPVADAAEARAVWHEQKLKYDNGGHIVQAFVVGSSGGVMGCSDDGEPSGTAGRPTLEVVKNSGITNLIVTTARWFGGIKLGTGGLVHAYSDCAKLALAEAQTRPLQNMAHLRLVLPYPVHESSKRMLADAGFERFSENFGSAVELTGRMPESALSQMQSDLRDLSKGSALVEVTAINLE